jgi:hypothetical protein
MGEEGGSSGPVLFVTQERRRGDENPNREREREREKEKAEALLQNDRSIDRSMDSQRVAADPAMVSSQSRAGTESLMIGDGRGLKSLVVLSSMFLSFFLQQEPCPNLGFWVLGFWV